MLEMYSYKTIIKKGKDNGIIIDDKLFDLLSKIDYDYINSIDYNYLKQLYNLYNSSTFEFELWFEFTKQQRNPDKGTVFITLILEQ